MKRKLVFSARYDQFSVSDVDASINSEDWLPDFQAPLDDRNTLADRLIGIASSISRYWQFDMDIYDSEASVDINLYLDDRPYLEFHARDVASLLFVCDSFDFHFYPTSRMACVTIRYEREL